MGQRRVHHQELARGKDWLIAYYPRVQCAYFGPEVDDASFEDYAQRLEQDIDARADHQRFGILYYVPDTTAMDSPRRRRIAKILAARKEKLSQTTAAFVVVTQSPFIRGVLSTMFWMAPPGYPNKAVATTGQGFAFLAQHLSHIDAAATNEAFEALLTTGQRRAS